MLHVLFSGADNRLYLRLLGYVRPYWLAFVVSIVCMGLSSIIEPVLPAMMKELLDKGFVQEPSGWSWLLYPAVLVVLFVIRAVLAFLGGCAMSWVGYNLVTVLRQAMFEKIVHLPVAYFGDNSSGRLLSRVTHDVTNATQAATEALTTMVKDSLSVVGLLGWLLYLNWKLTLITLAMLPFVALVVRTFSGRIRRLARSLQESQGAITDILQETIDGHKVVKIFGGQKYEVARFIESVQKQRRLNMRGNIAAAAQGPIVQFLAALSLAAILAIALKQAGSEASSVGNFVSFITAMLMMLTPLKRLTDINATIQRGLAASESVFKIIDQPGETDDGTVELGEARGEIEFDAVYFTYPESEKAALQDISFRVSPGECVALVGQSGGGKTTIANLIPRFYRIAAGAIRIDGHRLDDIRLASLRGNIALVSQDVVLFNDTVAANIAYGLQRHVEREQIAAAAKAANALEFIEAMPQGLDTLIGENGVKLSGGQRQRIAIARALLKDAPILILDEATSALDSESERAVQDALGVLMRGRSTIVIAHRLTTIEKADRIIVLKGGRIIETGGHEALLRRGGAYEKLYRSRYLMENPAV